MKILAQLLVSMSLMAGLSADRIQDIYQRAQEIVSDPSSGDDALYDFYVEATSDLDSITLMQNPELVFRRALAWLDAMEHTTMREVKSDFASLALDFKLVMNNTEPGSALFAASKLRKDFIDHILAANPQRLEDYPAITQAYWNRFLRHWSPGSHSNDKQLREEVLNNLKNSPELLDSFLRFAVLFADDPDIVLGYIQPDEIKIIGVVLDFDDDACVLKYRIEYSRPNGRTTSAEIGI